MATTKVRKWGSGKQYDLPDEMSGGKYDGRTIISLIQSGITDEISYLLWLRKEGNGRFTKDVELSMDLMIYGSKELQASYEPRYSKGDVKLFMMDLKKREERAAADEVRKEEGLIAITKERQVVYGDTWAVWS